MVFGRGGRKGGFSGKLVVVTGAAGGLGRALARRFGRAGARLALLDLDPDGLERLGAELRSEGSDCFEATCDVADEVSCRKAFGELNAAMGGVDVLINNAGITHRSFFAETECAVMRRVIEVNLIGSMHCTKMAIDSLVARRGQVIVISSMAGLGPLDGRAGYAASKHGLHGMFDTLRSELRDAGVGVLLVCPTFVDTGIGAAALSGDGGHAPRPQATVGKVATAEQTAEQIHSAAECRQNLLVPSLTGRLSHLIHKFAPRLYERLMSRAVRAEFEG